MLLLVTILLLNPMGTETQMEVGQVWKYQSREHESESRLTIVKIDEVKGERIYHIAIDGLSMRSPHAPDGIGRYIGHTPISESALSESLIGIAGVAESLPNYEEGYQIWRQAFEEGRAGYFTTSVKECVEFVEQAMNR